MKLTLAYFRLLSVCRSLLVLVHVLLYVVTPELAIVGKPQLKEIVVFKKSYENFEAHLVKTPLMRVICALRYVLDSILIVASLK